MAQEKRALTWHKGEGASHTMIDDGEGRTFGHKMAPILVPDGLFDAKTVLNHFLDSSRTLDSSIRETVVKVIAEYRN